MYVGFFKTRGTSRNPQTWLPACGRGCFYPDCHRGIKNFSITINSTVPNFVSSLSNFMSTVPNFVTQKIDEKISIASD